MSESQGSSKPEALFVTMTGEPRDRGRYMEVLWELAIKDRRSCVRLFDEKMMIFPKDEDDPEAVARRNGEQGE